MEQPLLELLSKYDNSDSICPIAVQSFDADILTRLRRDYNTDSMLFYLTFCRLTPEELDDLTSFANGVGLSRWLLEDSNGQEVHDGSLVSPCQERGLKVFVWTLGAEADVIHRFFYRYGVDGIICDNPDIAIKARFK
jgi:glycerophosphoryl diester phosphodiesterase